MFKKVCLIIGGTGGLGRACAEDLASKGHKVIVAGRNKSKGDTIVQTIKSAGGEATFLPVDITSPDSITQLHKSAVATYGGRLDVAVNGAGITGDFGKLADFTAENMNLVWQINVTGVMLSMQCQIHAMRANPGGSGGHIINFSSIYGLHGCQFGSAYVASKHALVGLTKAAALEYSNPRDNILVNAVAPGVIITEMTAVLDDPSGLPEGEMKEYMSGMKGLYPQGRFGKVEDVARGVKYLVESEWVTGTVLEIDGGYGAK
ncbi:hypothetical protein LTR37_014439 [Vermiconidia calcicola]|uniref:Uncharacterized protein n=1 Tax=Vermiconidia calcicola TaxID=1690605 RepID=A0ACC3MTQ5_9PEZI|nr:hypothetical protein LTR37_014439 [Vermiconidia calcicola]